MWVMWNLFSVHLETVLVSVQDRCTVCAESTIGLEIILDASDGTPRWHGSCRILLRSIWRQCYCRCKIGARFVPKVPLAQKSFWMHPIVLLGDKPKWNLGSVCLEIALILTQDRCTVYTEHTIGLKIILDAPDGTPRLRGSCRTSFRSVWIQCYYQSVWR
jgi:hypothetical protein